MSALRSPYATCNNPASLDMILNGGGFTYTGKAYYVAELVWLEGEGNYTCLHFKNGEKLLTSRSLFFWCDLFGDKVLRISKHAAVMFAEIAEMRQVYRSQSSGRKAIITLKRSEIRMESSRRLTKGIVNAWSAYRAAKQESTVGAVDSL